MSVRLSQDFVSEVHVSTPSALIDVNVNPARSRTQRQTPANVRFPFHNKLQLLIMMNLAY